MSKNQKEKIIMKKQLIAFGTLFVLALGTLPGMASCCSCQSDCHACPKACPCQSACPACPCPVAKPCCGLQTPCCPTVRPCCENPCFEAMPCPAAPIKPCEEKHTNYDLCD